tara:strand:- start:3862 stop:4797 length:936 start_codon:yes stop_codon:yes gene_type:complete
MKTFQRIAVVMTVPLLFLIPYFLFFSGGATEQQKPTANTPNIAGMIKTDKDERKDLVISKQRFESKTLTALDNRTKIQNSMHYLMHTPSKPWPEGIKFPLIVHLNDHNDTTYSAEYITQNQMGLAFPAFSVIPDIRGLYSETIIPPVESRSMRGTSFTIDKLNNPIKVVNFEELRSESKKILDPLMKLINNVKDEYPVDDKRIYIIGCGFGGATLFNLIEKNPNYFASAVIISSAWDTQNSRNFTATPMLLLTGKNNATFPSFAARSFADNVNGNGGKVAYQAYESMPYTCSYKQFYSSTVWKWMFAQDRP